MPTTRMTWLLLALAFTLSACGFDPVADCSTDRTLCIPCTPVDAGVPDAGPPTGCDPTRDPACRWP